MTAQAGMAKESSGEADRCAGSAASRIRRERETFVDEFLGLDVAFQELLRAVPGDLALDVAEIDAALGIEVRHDLGELVFRLLGEIGEDAPHLLDARPVAALALRADEGVVQIGQSLAIGDEEALDEIGLGVRDRGRSKEHRAAEAVADVADIAERMDLLRRD